MMSNASDLEPEETIFTQSDVDKLVAEERGKTWDAAIEVAKAAEATFYVEFADAMAHPRKLSELAAAKTVVAALQAARSQGEGKG